MTYLWVIGLGSVKVTVFRPASSVFLCQGLLGSAQNIPTVHYMYTENQYMHKEGYELIGEQKVYGSVYSVRDYSLSYFILYYISSVTFSVPRHFLYDFSLSPRAMSAHLSILVR